MNMRTAILVLIALFAFDASASRQRQTVLLPPGTDRCTGDYVLVGKLGALERELARVPCADLPKCVKIKGMWPDSMVYGFVNGKYVLAVRPPVEEPGNCPDETPLP